MFSSRPSADRTFRLHEPVVLGGDGRRSSDNLLEESNASEDLVHPCLSEGADIGTELSFLQGCEFARLDNASFWEIGLANLDDHVAGKSYALGVGREGAGDDGGDAAVVEQVILENDVGVGDVGIKRGPIDVAAVD